MSPRDRVNSNLLALGSAAVMAVYSAGYVRTKPAWDLSEALEERPPLPPALSQPIAAPVSPVAPAVSAGVSATTAGADTNRPAATTASRTATTQIAPATRSSATSAVDSGTLPPPPPTPTPATAGAPLPADTAKPAAAEPGAYKDGVYLAWGPSRHGPIQVGVEIKNGRMNSAFIADCQTNYPCTWVDHLPRQAVQRQSPDVDYVSGATQSANAVYRAIVDALGQARK
jgi:uncharacterized protein with FMN-binding domain